MLAGSLMFASLRYGAAADAAAGGLLPTLTGPGRATNSPRFLRASRSWSAKDAATVGFALLLAFCLRLARSGRCEPGFPPRKTLPPRPASASDRGHLALLALELAVRKIGL